MKYIIFTTLLFCLFSCKEIENNIKKDDIVAISKSKTNFLHLDNNNYENIPLIIQKNGKNITDILCELKFMEVNYSTKGNKGEFIIYLIDKHLNSMKINTVFKQYLLSGFRGEFAQFLHLNIDKYLLHKKNELNEFQKIELLSICLWIDIYANGSIDVWRKYFVINHTQNILMSEKNIRNFIAGEMNEHSFIENMYINKSDIYQIVHNINNEFSPNVSKIDIEVKRRFNIVLSIIRYQAIMDIRQGITQKYKWNIFRMRDDKFFDINAECIKKYKQ